MYNKGTAYNRAYLASCLRHFAQILLRRTSEDFLSYFSYILITHMCIYYSHVYIFLLFYCSYVPKALGYILNLRRFPVSAWQNYDEGYELKLLLLYPLF